MPKPKLRQKPGKVYFSPVETPETETPRRFREVKGAIMPADSQESSDLWYDILIDMGNECPDRTRTRRQRSR